MQAIDAAAARHSLGARAVGPPDTRRPAYAEIAAWWLGSRLLVLATAFAVDRLAWPRALAGGTVDLLAAWDGNWYRVVAERGYLLTPEVQSDVAFLPALPLLLAGAGAIDLPLATTSVVVAHAAFAVALAAVYELGRRWLPEDVARRAAVYLAIFPFSFVFSLGYPESMALAGVALAGLLAAGRSWLGAGLAAAMAALSRPQGVLVAVPLVARALRERGGPAAVRGGRWFAALAAPVALAAFSLYLWRVVGEPLAWTRAQELWGRDFSPAGPYHALRELWLAPLDRALTFAPHKLWLLRDFAAFLLYAALLWAARGVVPRAWLVYGALVVALPVMSGTFTSVARLGLLALPVFWGLARLANSPRRHRLVLVLSPVLLAANVVTLPLRHP